MVESDEWERMWKEAVVLQSYKSVSTGTAMAL
jgi:hypothetical protein